MAKKPQNISIPKTTLSIAGAAAGGSAGIYADLKTFEEIGVYGMSVITAIVGRHPKTDKNIHPISVEAIEAQFSSASSRGIDGMKTGMLFSEKIIKAVAQLLQNNSFTNLVVDPVMVGKLDSKLLNDNAIGVLKTEILPLAKVITPNMFEASILLDDRTIETVEDIARAAKDLYEQNGSWVLVKGGGLKGPAVDVLYDGKEALYYEAERISTKNTSGAGCSYSAAIAAYLAKGESVKKAVELAKQFVTTAISYSFSYNDKPGPINHMAVRHNEDRVKIKVYK